MGQRYYFAPINRSENPKFSASRPVFLAHEALLPAINALVISIKRSRHRAQVRPSGSTGMPPSWHTCTAKGEEVCGERGGGKQRQAGYSFYRLGAATTNYTQLVCFSISSKNELCSIYILYLCILIGYLTYIQCKSETFHKVGRRKGQLIKQLEALFPVDFDKRSDITYIEPFVGGGAVLFHILQTYKNIKCAVINDINPDLINCYKAVRDQPNELIRSLTFIQEDFYAIKDEDAQKAYYLSIRDRFNSKPATR